VFEEPKTRRSRRSVALPAFLHPYLERQLTDQARRREARSAGSPRPGVITEFPATPHSGLQDITVGPDGNLWFTELGGHRIGRITMAGVITDFPVLQTHPLHWRASGPLNLSRAHRKAAAESSQAPSLARAARLLSSSP
jgi:hypothetical protein